MERLTVFDGEFWVHKNFPPVGEDTIDEFIDCVKELAARLAAYEDTGLEPDDIKRVFNEDAVLNLAGQALGITPDRLRELAQADREGTNCTPAELSEEIGQKKAVAHEEEVYGERMLGFLHSFKTELEKQFGPMESDWDARSRTVGWASALKAASEKHLPEIWALWDALDWWASDLLDSWIIDCAVYMGLCKREESGNAAD